MKYTIFSYVKSLEVLEKQIEYFRGKIIRITPSNVGYNVIFTITIEDMIDMQNILSDENIMGYDVYIGDVNCKKSSYLFPKLKPEGIDRFNHRVVQHVALPSASNEYDNKNCHWLDDNCKKNEDAGEKIKEVLNDAVENKKIDLPNSEYGKMAVQENTNDNSFGRHYLVVKLTDILMTYLNEIGKQPDRYKVVAGVNWHVYGFHEIKLNEKSLKRVLRKVASRYTDTALSPDSFKFTDLDYLTTANFDRFRSSADDEKKLEQERRLN